MGDAFEQQTVSEIKTGATRCEEVVERLCMARSEKRTTMAHDGRRTMQWGKRRQLLLDGRWRRQRCNANRNKAVTKETDAKSLPNEAVWYWERRIRNADADGWCKDREEKGGKRGGLGKKMGLPYFFFSAVSSKNNTKKHKEKLLARPTETIEEWMA